MKKEKVKQDLEWKDWAKNKVSKIKIFFFSTEKSSILKSTVLISIVLMIAKIIGFVKQAIIGFFYGANIETDIFFLSVGIVESIVKILFTPLSIGIITLYIKEKRKSKELGSLFISNLLTFFIPISLFITILFYIGAPYLSMIIAPTYSLDKEQLLIKNFQIISIISIFALLQTIFSAVLNSEKIFLPEKFNGIINSGCIILMVIFFSNMLKGKALIFAFVLSYVLQVIFLFYFLNKKIKYIFTNPFKDKRLKEILKLMFPLIISNMVLQGNTMVDKIIVVNLGEGFISALSYGHTLALFINNMLIASGLTVLFSYLASYDIKIDKIKIEETMKKFIIGFTLILIPISVITIVLSKDIVKVLYERGNFQEEAVILTTSVIVGYALGFCTDAIREVYIRGHYVYKDTKRPMCIGIFTVIINIILSIYLSKKIGLFGVVLATSISSLISAILAIISFRKYSKNLGVKNLRNTFLKILLAGFTSLIFSKYLIVILKIENLLLKIVLVTILTLSIYLISLILLKCKEINFILTNIKNLKYMKKFK